MIKARALHAVNDMAAPEFSPLVSDTAPCKDTPEILESQAPEEVITRTIAEACGSDQGIDGLVSGMQNIVIQSAGDISSIPAAVRALAVKMMHYNTLRKDLFHELRQMICKDLMVWRRNRV